VSELHACPHVDSLRAIHQASRQASTATRAFDVLGPSHLESSSKSLTVARATASPLETSQRVIRFP
jgi:hypothetical protein